MQESLVFTGSTTPEKAALFSSPTEDGKAENTTELGHTGAAVVGAEEGGAVEA
jgi:hypothetical protein